ncbi:MAG: hypothetical protein ACI8U0_002133 [Flavobacteriales bacterium]|jgi:hypothetical protein
MVAVNQEWNKYPEAVTSIHLNFDSDIDRIAKHLHLVIDHLKENTLLTYDENQLEKRFQLLAELEKYASDKKFPINTGHKSRQPYFIDDYGTHCAVGFLIAESGNEDLAQKISKEHNYDYIKDIKTEELFTWANEHGFTLDELKWIQPEYPAATVIESVGNGTDGAINNFCYQDGLGLIFSGSFNTVNSLPCINIGLYTEDQLSCLGQGLIGVINDIHIIDSLGTLVTAGLVTNNNSSYPAAIFQDNSWEYLQIPERIGATGHVLYKGGSISDGTNENQYSYIIVISHPSLNGTQEVWRYFDNDGWIQMASLTGVVKDIAHMPEDIAFVGNFNSITNAYTNETIYTNNVALNNIFTNSWSTIDGTLNDTVYTALTVANSTFFTGTCNSYFSDNNTCISRYYNNNLQTVVINNTNDYGWINKLAHQDGTTELILGGKFHLNLGSDYGFNLGKYNYFFDGGQMLAAPNDEVKDLAFINDQLYLGGHFTGNWYTENLKHLARVFNPVGIGESNLRNENTIYPNPFNDHIILDSDINNFEYEIYSMTGQMVKEGFADGKNINGLDNLVTGLYTVHVFTNSKTFNHKIIKE